MLRSAATRKAEPLLIESRMGALTTVCCSVLSFDRKHGRNPHVASCGPMNILGINSVYHESAAALVVDGALVAASEEERFNRIKHGKQSDVDNPHQFPEHAIRFCLDYAGLRGCDIDHVAYSFDPQLRRMQFRAEWWPDPRWEEVFLLRLGEVRGVAERILRRPLGKDFISCLTIWRMLPRRISRQASIARLSSPSTASARWPARR